MVKLILHTWEHKLLDAEAGPAKALGAYWEFLELRSKNLRPEGTAHWANNTDVAGCWLAGSK